MTRLNKEEMESAEIIACFWHSQRIFRSGTRSFGYAVTQKPGSSTSNIRSDTEAHKSYCCIMIKLLWNWNIQSDGKWNVKWGKRPKNIKFHCFQIEFVQIEK